jgi:hypothetical protein
MGIQQTVSYQAASLEEIAVLLDQEVQAFEVKNFDNVRGMDKEKAQAALEREYAKGLRRAAKVPRATTRTPNPSST